MTWIALYLAGWAFTRFVVTPGLPAWARLDAHRQGVPQSQAWVVRWSCEATVLGAWWLMLPAFAACKLIAATRSIR